MVILKLASFVLFFVTGARSGSQFLPLESGTEYISPHEIFGFRKESRKGNRPRTASEMDGPLHTDFRKSKTSRDIKKYF